MRIGKSGTEVEVQTNPIRVCGEGKDRVGSAFSGTISDDEKIVVS